MDHHAIREQMIELVSDHLPSNARRFKFRIYDDQPQKSVLGFPLDPQPFEGRVIVKTNEAIVIKTGRTEFAVIDRRLATREPEEGARVRVQPYVRRRFDGLRADTPEEEIHQNTDGSSYSVKTFLLGSAPAKLPIPQPQCPQLQELIAQLEGLPAPDGFRCISHLLVDANARDFSWVDPLPDDIFDTPPAINFTVATNKFSGRVRILYDRANDLYAVELYRDDERVEHVYGVYFDQLGDVLEHMIDDGSWRRIQVDILSVREPVAE